MAFGTRAIGTLAAVALALLPSACGGDGESRSLLTLTDSDCTYEGDQAVSATATFEAELENKNSKLGAFEIVKIDAGSTFADVEAYVQSEQKGSRKVSRSPARRPTSHSARGLRSRVERAATWSPPSPRARGSRRACTARRTWAWSARRS